MVKPEEERHPNQVIKRAITTCDIKRCARKFVLIGSKKSGKSALVHRFLHDDFTEDYTPTVEEHYVHNVQFHMYNLNLDIVDMCAPFTFPVMRDLNVSNAHIILLVYEIGNSASVEEAVNAYENIKEKGDAGLSVVLVGTKLDLDSRDICIDEYEATDELFKKLPKVNAGHILTSAKLNISVHKSFEMGLEWHAMNNHSGSLVDSKDIKEFKEHNKKRCAIQ